MREKAKIPTPGTTFSNFGVLGGHGKLLPLCHTVVRAPKSPLQGGALSDQR